MSDNSNSKLLIDNNEFEVSTDDIRYNVKENSESEITLIDNKELAIEYLIKASDLGVSEAQFRLGFSYRKGDGVKQNNKMAFKYYSLAAKQNHAFAQNNLGILYIHHISLFFL